jgi:hypothetical protein
MLTEYCSAHQFYLTYITVLNLTNATRNFGIDSFEFSFKFFENYKLTSESADFILNPQFILKFLEIFLGILYL